MRDEDEVQEMADIASDYANGKRVRTSGPDVSKVFAEGVMAALDWVLDEEMDEKPL